MNKSIPDSREREMLISYLSTVATVTLECTPEDEQIEGNASACGDDKLDEECNEWIREQLRSGNEWAWCCAVVTAEFHAPSGRTYTTRDYLGCCSYESEAQFRADMLPDMRTNVICELADKILSAANPDPDEEARAIIARAVQCSGFNTIKNEVHS